MSRLTKDLRTPHDDTTYSDVVVNAVDRENICLTKLKHYEDLEEELGIDLITLFKEIKKVPKIMDDIKALKVGITHSLSFSLNGIDWEDDYYNADYLPYKYYSKNKELENDK